MVALFNIQKYSVHDGPGIRTTVFLKGCPLQCQWCHNPEGIDPKPVLLFNGKKCIQCGACVSQCPEGALDRTAGEVTVAQDKCTRCGLCHEACPTEALQLSGGYTSTEAVMEEVLKDRVFYEESGGGVTFSGGEPMLQAEALKELLIQAKKNGIHTAVDTSGFAPWEAFEAVRSHVDLFLYDVKHMCNDAHEKYTGVANSGILSNLERLSRAGARIWVRIPVIPGVNDDESHAQQLGRMLSSLNIQQVHLLPYHNYAGSKYHQLGMRNAFESPRPLSKDSLEGMKAIIENYGCSVRIGG